MSDPLPSGTVVVLRDAPRLELLLLERNVREGTPGQEPGAQRGGAERSGTGKPGAQRGGAERSGTGKPGAQRGGAERSGTGKPGAWVFPGGKVERGDVRDAEDDERDARRAAVREAYEEAGLRLDADALVPISRWITPTISPKRFDTWFFATAAAPDAPVRVDGCEIADHRWLAPADALEAHHARELRLAPPTFVTVTWLAEFADVSEALQVLPQRVPPPFHPRIHRVETGACMLYPGDAGYESGELGAAGPRHRLWALNDPWRYERT